MGFKTREEHRKEKELEEARKAGLAPAEVDEDGKEINPHIPQYMADMPWYLNKEKKQSTLKHQKDWRTGQKIKDQCYSRGVKTHQADRYRKGACENCGAMSHDVKSCMERPRKKGAKFTNMFIAPDEKIEDLDLSYEAKRDRWNGCDAGSYGKEIQRTFDKKEEARKKYLTEQQLKKLENGDTNNEDLEDSSDDDDDEKEDGLKLDETEQVGFAKVEKRVRTTGGGSTGTVRSLRMREDCAKYLRNLDVNSAHYDPKTRSMREDPNPDVDPNEKFYGGDNMYRNSGQAAEFKELQIHAWDSYDRGHDVHMQAAPSQAELLHKNHKAIREKLITQKNNSLREKYGNATTEEEIPKELLLGQTEIEIEYDRAGRIIKGQMSVILPRSKYDEDNYINNHTEIWGSWWKDCQWGYKCCKQIIKNSYCTGSAGIEAAEAAVELMMANMARKETADVDGDVEVEKKNHATWGSDVPDDLVLDAKILSRALEKEGGRKREERDERKRKYNVRWEDEVTAEDVEAYRLKRAHYDDPMTKFQD